MPVIKKPHAPSIMGAVPSENQIQAAIKEVLVVASDADKKLSPQAKKVLTDIALKQKTMKLKKQLSDSLADLDKVTAYPKMTVIKDDPLSKAGFEQAQLPGVKVPEEHANVYVEFSRKVSDGNYGSVGFTVGLNMPCGMKYHELEEAYEGAQKFVDEKLSGLLSAVIESKKG